ncbi:YcxB family protein [Segatella oris]|uniref:YcxB family protein n=1 Tax=Segatella oris TaxID=28135 RepID=UPI0036241E58
MEDFIMFNRVISNTEYHFNRSATIASIAMLLIWGPCILSTATHDPMLTAKLSIFSVLLTAFYNWYIRKRRDRRAAKLYEQNKVLSSMTKFKISLFDDHFESQTDTEQSTVSYNKLYKIIETPTHFYFMYAKNQGIIIAKEGEAMTDFVLKLKEKYKL